MKFTIANILKINICKIGLETKKTDSKLLILDLVFTVTTNRNHFRLRVGRFDTCK